MRILDSYAVKLSRILCLYQAMQTRETFIDTLIFFNYFNGIVPLFIVVLFAFFTGICTRTL